ncbi:hypothetical protein AAVH_02227 [Aphelenchoides avenae]|nr:hypothetical protein AAVH_02227 [Aphelenchus avenae]
MSYTGIVYDDEDHPSFVLRTGEGETVKVAADDVYFNGNEAAFFDKLSDLREVRQEGAVSPTEQDKSNEAGGYDENGDEELTSRLCALRRKDAASKEGVRCSDATEGQADNVQDTHYGETCQDGCDADDADAGDTDSAEGLGAVNSGSECDYASEASVNTLRADYRRVLDANGDYVGGHGTGHDEVEELKELLNQTDPMETSMENFVNDMPEEELPRYKSWKYDELEQAERAIRKREREDRRRKREAKKAKKEQRIRAELRQEHDAELKRMNANLRREYEAKLTAVRSDLQRTKADLEKKYEAKLTAVRSEHEAEYAATSKRRDGDTPPSRKRRLILASASKHFLPSVPATSVVREENDDTTAALQAASAAQKDANDDHDDPTVQQPVPHDAFSDDDDDFSLGSLTQDS